MAPLSSWNGRCPKEAPSPKGTPWLLSPEVAMMHRQINATRRTTSSMAQKENSVEPDQIDLTSPTPRSHTPKEVSTPLTAPIYSTRVESEAMLESMPGQGSFTRSTGCKSYFSPRRRARLLTSAGRLPTPSSHCEEESQESPFRQPDGLMESIPEPSLMGLHDASPTVKGMLHRISTVHRQRRRRSVHPHRAASPLRLFVGLIVLIALLFLTGTWSALLTAALSDIRAPQAKELTLGNVQCESRLSAEVKPTTGSEMPMEMAFDELHSFNCVQSSFLPVFPDTNYMPFAKSAIICRLRALLGYSFNLAFHELWRTCTSLYGNAFVVGVSPDFIFSRIIRLLQLDALESTCRANKGPGSPSMQPEHSIASLAHQAPWLLGMHDSSNGAQPSWSHP